MNCWQDGRPRCWLPLQGRLTGSWLCLQDYCLNKEDFEYIQDVTHFKGSYSWNQDVYKGVPTAVKSAFTR